MKLVPLLLQAGDDITNNITKIFDINSVVQAEGTVLDSEFQINGATIPLGRCIETDFGEFTSVKIPPCAARIEDGIVVLDDIAVRANNLLRVIDLVEAGEKKASALIKSLVNYQNLVLTRITGKKGLICRNILGRRCSHTGRAVLLPSYSMEPSEVYVPTHMMRKMGVKDGEVVLVGRDPTIWMGSVEVLKAFSTEENVIRLHPFVFGQFGADCDGDTVWVMRVPEDMQSDMAPNVLKFAKKHQSDIKRASPGLPPVEIDWDDPAMATRAMAVTTGFSVSPLDILNQSNDLTRFKDSTGKDVAKEALAIASGLSHQEYCDYLTTINETMLIQKVYLGPVGAAAQKLKLIAGENELLVESANYVSERIQQMLFDIKGSVTGDSDDLKVFFEILDIVNLTGDYSSAGRVVTHDRVLSRMAEIGFDMDLCTPMIVYIYTVFPLLQATWDVASSQLLKEDITKEDRAEAIELVSRVLYHPDKVSTICEEVAKMLGVNASIIVRTAMSIKSELNLGFILRDPLFTLINPFSRKKVIRSIRYLDEVLNQGGNPDSIRLTDWVFTKSLEPINVRNIDAGIETKPVGLSL